MRIPFAVRRLGKRIVNPLGYDVIRYYKYPELSSLPVDLTPLERDIVTEVIPFTMTGVRRVVALVQATKHIVENDIPGDFVECGVWRGGSMMAVALTLLRMGDMSRRLFLYDTFAGMSPPTERDVRVDGASAARLLEMDVDNVRCYAERADAERNLSSTGYPADKICFVQGRVEDTIPGTIPDAVCLLRLDTDWYESTRHELTHLYPRLVRHGVLIVDDYGHWRGAREATDEFLNSLTIKPLLCRIDYSCRVAVKSDGGS